MQTLMTENEILEFLNCSKKTLLRMIKAGDVEIVGKTSDKRKIYKAATTRPAPEWSCSNKAFIKTAKALGEILIFNEHRLRTTKIRSVLIKNVERYLSAEQIMKEADDGFKNKDVTIFSVYAEIEALKNLLSSDTFFGKRVWCIKDEASFIKILDLVCCNLRYPFKKHYAIEFSFSVPSFGGTFLTSEFECKEEVLKDLVKTYSYFLDINENKSGKVDIWALFYVGECGAVVNDNRAWKRFYGKDVFKMFDDIYAYVSNKIDETI